jgi:DNA-binding transcriptional regulator YdaS (Cro superfamily)
MKLDQYLRENRITQTAFAAQVGVPVSRVNDWVRGNGKPTLERLAAIQAATGGAVGLADFVEVRDV